jgi:hypothetical protein
LKVKDDAREMTFRLFTAGEFVDQALGQTIAQVFIIGIARQVFSGKRLSTEG